MEASITSPWLIGIAESFSGAKLLLNTTLESKTRQALILIDSALEIAFKEYLMRKCKLKQDPVWESREKLLKIVKSKASQIKEEEWEHLSFFHEKRNPLYHEEAGMTLTATLTAQLFQLSVSVVERLFETELQPLIKEPMDIIEGVTLKRPNLTKFFKREVDPIIVAVKFFSPASYSETAENTQKLGYKKALQTSRVSALMNSISYKHFFYFDKKQKSFILTDVGEDEFVKIAQGEIKSGKE